MRKPKTQAEALQMLKPYPLRELEETCKQRLQVNSKLLSKTRCPILLLDTSCIGWQIYSTQCSGAKCHLRDVADIVMTQLLKRIFQICKLFSSPNPVLIWDSRIRERALVYPEYKGDRNKYLPPSEIAKLVKMKKALVQFRKKIVPLLGINSLFQKGYEADDIIAILTRTFEDTSFIIVANDGDLFQLLRPGVSIYHTQMSTIIDRKEFLAHHHYSPEKVVACKSVGGCHSDNVKGVPKIGEVRATAFLNGKLNGDYFSRIVRDWEIVIRNKKLVSIPYIGTRMPKLKPFSLDIEGLEKACGVLGVPRLVSQKDQLNAFFNGDRH